MPYLCAGPGRAGGFWHVGCLPLKYLTLPESGTSLPARQLTSVLRRPELPAHCISPVNIQLT